MRVVHERIYVMLANKLSSWFFDGWISTSVMSLGGNRSEFLGGSGSVSFGLGCHGHGERNNDSAISNLGIKLRFL